MVAVDVLVLCRRATRRDPASQPLATLPPLPRRTLCQPSPRCGPCVLNLFYGAKGYLYVYSMNLYNSTWPRPPAVFADGRAPRALGEPDFSFGDSAEAPGASLCAHTRQAARQRTQTNGLYTPGMSRYFCSLGNERYYQSDQQHLRKSELRVDGLFAAVVICTESVRRHVRAGHKCVGDIVCMVFFAFPTSCH